MTGAYDLDHDLAAIGRTLNQDLPEAVIFYCGRALEATAARAVAALNLDPGSQVFANLDTLERLSCISRPALYLGHALRRLANDARHILRPLSKHDADFAALCIGPWLQWYLEDYFRGPRTRVKDESFGIASPLASGNVAAALALLRQSETADEDISARLLALADENVARIPALSAMIAESLISCGRADGAETVLKASLAQVPDDLRLNQLYALCRRRLGFPDEAVALLRKLSGRFSEDEDTLGITAGALKAHWERDHSAADLLTEARQLYAKGWQVSRERNFYLGVNAAAIELWQGIPACGDRARHIAALFARRNADLARSGIDVSGQRDYYDLVTEAEARLLAGEEDAPRALYAEAFRRFAARKGDIAGSVEQANRSLALLGRKPIA
jgi:hypothetical protein